MNNQLPFLDYRIPEVDEMTELPDSPKMLNPCLHSVVLYTQPAVSQTGDGEVKRLEQWLTRAHSRVHCSRDTWNNDVTVEKQKGESEKYTTAYGNAQCRYML